MKPVDQTLFDDEGNCLAASVASLLGLPIEQVPDLRGPRWWPTLSDWLAPHGRPVRLARAPADPAVFVLGLGDGPRGRLHAVVWQGGPDGGRLAHDPHPSREGLVGPPFGYVALVPG